MGEAIQQLGAAPVELHVAVGLEGLLAWPATSTQPDVRLLKQCLTESFQVWLTGSQSPEA